MKLLFTICLYIISLTLGAGERPNIVFILTDDQRDNSFAAMGHKWVETLNIDQLLQQGVRFKNAYIAEPTCRPSRAAILLGCHERLNRNGFSSAHQMTPEQWADSYPELLRKAGYKTAYIGKWHVKKTGLKFEEMFDHWNGHDGHGPFYFENVKSDGSKVTETTNRHHTNSALKFLQSDLAQKAFCLSIGYATPHGSKVKSMHKKLNEAASENPNLKGHSIYDGKYRNIPISYPLQTPQNAYSHIPKNVMDQNKGRSKVYNYDYTPVTNKEHHFRYYQMITEIDQMVGELIAELKKQNLADNTVIIYASDHGVLMGEYGMGGKGLLYDLASKFPCFLYDPSLPKEQRGLSKKELVSSLDLTTTILDYAGVDPAPFMSGQSLKSLLHDKKETPAWRQGLFLENMYTGRDTPFQEGYTDGEWKYIRFYKKPSLLKNNDVDRHSGQPIFEMLFSLKNDPQEINNLAKQPEYKEKLNELRRHCNKNLSKILEARKKYSLTYKLK